MILHGTKYLECIKNRLSKSVRNRLAVAFWGEGAIKSLGLSRPENNEILCNLTMGGTNPEEIKQLLDQGFSVRHSPRLHAKIFRFDDAAVVGSANASANGLGFEGGELNGWSELGVLVTDSKDLREIDLWLDGEFAAAQKIEEDDLLKAAKLHNDRRVGRPPVVPERKFGNVLEALIDGAEDFRDRPIYLACDTTEFSRQGFAQQKAVQKEFGDEFDIYEGWDHMPTDAHLIAFWDNGDGTFSFQGFYTTDKILGVRQKNGTTYQIVKNVKSVPTNTCVGAITKAGLAPVAAWYKILSQIKAQSPRWEDEQGCCVELSEIARQLEEGSLILPSSSLKRTVST